MDELAGTENRIAVERMRYNERVQAVQHLPAAVPGQRHGGDLRLQRVSAVPGARIGQGGAEGRFRAAANAKPCPGTGVRSAGQC